MQQYSETIQRSSAEQIAAAYERGAKDRLADRQRDPSPGQYGDIASLPLDQRRAYADGWLDMFKAEARGRQS